MLGGIASAQRVRVYSPGHVAGPGNQASARTVGCCAHVVTIIWCLRKGKYAQYKPKSGTFSTTVN